MSARADVRFVARADVLQFCRRNNVHPSRLLAGSAVLAGVVAVVAVLPAAGLVAGLLLASLGRELGWPAQAAGGSVLALLAARGLLGALGGLSAGSRGRVFAPRDIAVLRHFEVSLAAVLAVRVTAPAAVRQLAGVAVASGVLTGLGLGYGEPLGGDWPWFVAALTLAATCLTTLAAARPPAPRRGGPIRSGAALALVGAAGWAAGHGVVLVAELVSAAGTGAAVAATASAAGTVWTALTRPVVALLLVAASAAAVGVLLAVDAKRWRAVLRPAAPAAAARRGACRPMDLAALAVRRGEQGGAVLARRGAWACTGLGALLVGAGIGAYGRLAPLLSGTDTVAGRGALLAVGLVLAGLVRTIAGPAAWSRQLRWTAEQGYPVLGSRALAVGYVAGLLRPVLPLALVCAGVGLLTADPAVVVFGAAVVPATAAANIVSDLHDRGAQTGPDGSTESTAAGAVAGMLVVGAAMLPWIVLPAPASWLAGIALGAALLAGATFLLQRKVLS